MTDHLVELARELTAERFAPSQAHSAGTQPAAAQDDPAAVARRVRELLEDQERKEDR